MKYTCTVALRKDEDVFRRQISRQTHQTIIYAAVNEKKMDYS
jgi:hypothetical protein